MRSERGYTMFEVLIVIGLIGVVSAIAVPVFMESNKRSSLWTGAEQIGSNIRSARLKAISQNAGYRVVFNCPSINTLRTLIITGDADVDDVAELPTRCNDSYEGDSGVIELPGAVEFSIEDDASFLQVSGRGIFTAEGGPIPLTITVTSGGATRLLTVSGTGQVTFTDVD